MRARERENEELWACSCVTSLSFSLALPVPSVCPSTCFCQQRERERETERAGLSVSFPGLSVSLTLSMPLSVYRSSVFFCLSDDRRASVKTERERKSARRCLSLTPSLSSVRFWSFLFLCFVPACFAQRTSSTPQIAETVAGRFQKLHMYAEAADIYEKVEMEKEAVEALMTGELWDRARKLAAKLGPDYVQYVEKEYMASLETAGDAHKIAQVDVEAGLDLMGRQGQWDECLRVAEQNGQDCLRRHATKKAKWLVGNDRLQQAVQTLVQYGASREAQFRPFLLQLAKDAIKDDICLPEIREILGQLVASLGQCLSVSRILSCAHRPRAGIRHWQERQTVRRVRAGAADQPLRHAGQDGGEGA